MSRRPTAYTILALIAVVLALIPSAIWPDMIVPMADSWNNWYWEGQPHPRPNYTLQNAPPLFRAEVGVFKALVLPPAYAKRFIRGYGTSYSVLWVPPYMETDGLPPLASTLDHLRWAVPLWFLVGVLCFETWRWARRRA